MTPPAPGPSWIPEPLRALGPADLAWWQWIGLVALALAGIALGLLAAAVVRRSLSNLVARSAVTWDDQLLDRLRRPLRLLCALAVYRLALPLLELPPAAMDVAGDVLYVVFGLALVSITLGVIDIGVTHTTAAPWAIARPSSRALVLLGGRIVKAVVLAIAVIALLGGLGVAIASLIAGLGIGGIALAFGAQKTVENLFGAFALGVDQPLREGDTVRIENEVTGTVESVGLRSTRFRTPDRTIVSLPNGRVADMRIETFALRDRFRFHAMIGLVYGTTVAQLETVLAGFERVLRDHPSIWTDDISVRFIGFGTSALELEVQAWFRTGDLAEFRGWRQGVLIEFMKLVEAAGTSFAFPTQTIHVASLPAKAAG
jgi:MscS family membrane protein